MTAEIVVAVAAGGIAGLASIPHCIGMCGPLSAFACARAGRRDAPLRYQLGRTASYCAAGLAIGQVGDLITSGLSGPWASAMLSWSFAVALALAAYSLWRAGQPERTSLVTLGTSARPRSRFDGLLQRVAKSAALFGALTVLLPCGALVAALVLAAGTGSAVTGAFVMVAFSLASGLGLFAAGWLATRLGAARRPWASRILSVVLMVGAVLFVVRPVPTLASPDPEAQPACCELTHPHRW